MDVRLILADTPGAWTTFTSRGKEYRARFDPLWLGLDRFTQLLDKPGLVWQLIDEQQRFLGMAADPFGKHNITLLGDYLEAVGLSFAALAEIFKALRHADALEIDLLRLGIEIRDWFDLDKPLSTRRMAGLIRDLQERPETQIGALHFNVMVADKAAIVTAQFYSSMADGDYQHSFLRSPAEVEAERKELIEAAEKRDRIAKQTPAVLPSVSADKQSFQHAKNESLRMLAEIQAST